jgi:ketosteroid isomerase-like protein
MTNTSAGTLSALSQSERARAVFSAFDAKDVSALVRLVTDDVRLRLGNAGTVEGKAAFVDAVNEFLGSVAGFRHEIINVWRDGDTLVTELEVHYTRLDGKQVTIPCCNIFRQATVGFTTSREEAA